MDELMRTNDPVLVTAIETLLAEVGIGVLVLDQNISFAEGSIGAFPRRLMVRSDALAEARELVREAGFGHELREPK